MQGKVRVSFLPLFLICVVVAFATAVAMRLRAYATATAPAQAQSPSPSTAASAPAIVAGRAASPSKAMPGTDASGGVNAVPAATSAQAATAMAASKERVSRAQRFNELLSQPLGGSVAPAPIGPAPIAPVPQPRVLPKPLPPAPKPVAVAKSVVTGSSRSGNSPSGNPGPPPPSSSSDMPKKDPGPHKNDDPSSDTTPPRLLGVDFVPQQVHDGDEATVVILADDDISGIASISGTVTSPSGKALQGFSVQKDPQQPNRYIGKLMIPAKAEEGLWRVNFISLRDNASNTVNLHYNQGQIPQTAVLHVISSQPDSTPPTLRRVYVERRTMKGGEKNTVFIEADDDKSGVKFASGVFQSPSRFARLSFGCQKGDSESQWVCAMNTPEKIDCGDWKLEQVQLQDNANNMATIRQDNQLVAAVKVNIYADGCDSTPPVLEALTVDQRVVNNTPGSAVVFTATVSDDQSGISGVMAQAIGPGQGSGKWFSFTVSGESPNIWAGHFEVPANAGKGIWRIAFVQVIDKANNLKLYSSADPQLKDAMFEVR